MSDTEFHIASKVLSKLDVMNFLNEMAENFPQAISFASGRPADSSFKLSDCADYLDEFVDYYARTHQVSAARASHLICQYGRTNGIVNPLVVQQLKLDQGIQAEAENIVLTSGCQEAIEICVRSFCTDANDVILARSPCYIGISGVAELHSKAMAGFTAMHDEAIFPALQQAVQHQELVGKRVRLLYLVADFDNPTGSVIPLGIRQQLLAYCAEKQIVILEDNPYGMFRFEGQSIASLFALDTQGCVIYLGTYSKTICPALRLGFALFPAQLFGKISNTEQQVQHFAQIKSLLTVNTSQISQAIVGGVLLREQFSLQRLIAPALTLYRQNRDLMLQELQREFSDLMPEISWNKPEGGFFLIVQLPFVFTQTEASICARDYGVIVMPLSYFALLPGSESAIRLAYSNVTSTQIIEGVRRLGRFIKDRMAGLI